MKKFFKSMFLALALIPLIMFSACFEPKEPKTPSNDEIYKIFYDLSKTEYTGNITTISKMQTKTINVLSALDEDNKEVEKIDQGAMLEGLETLISKNTLNTTTGEWAKLEGTEDKEGTFTATYSDYIKKEGNDHINYTKSISEYTEPPTTYTKTKVSSDHAVHEFGDVSSDIDISSDEVEDLDTWDKFSEYYKSMVLDALDSVKDSYDFEMTANPSVSIGVDGSQYKISSLIDTKITDVTVKDSEGEQPAPDCLNISISMEIKFTKEFVTSTSAVMKFTAEMTMPNEAYTANREQVKEDLELPDELEFASAKALAGMEMSMIEENTHTFDETLMPTDFSEWNETELETAEGSISYYLDDLDSQYNYTSGELGTAFEFGKDSGSEIIKRENCNSTDAIVWYYDKACTKPVTDLTVYPSYNIDVYGKSTADEGYSVVIYKDTVTTITNEGTSTYSTTFVEVVLIENYKIDTEIDNYDDTPVTADKILLNGTEIDVTAETGITLPYNVIVRTKTIDSRTAE